MKRLFVVLTAALLAAPVLGAERSVGLNVTYGPDSYLVDYPSGSQQTLSIDASYTEVYKISFFRFGWSADLGYSHLWGDNVETKTDVDEMVERNDALDTFHQFINNPNIMPSTIFSSYQWIYSDFHGFKTKGLALAGVEYKAVGVDLMSGLGIDYAFMKTEIGDVGVTDQYLFFMSMYKATTGNNLDLESFKKDLGGTCHMMQFSVPLEIRPFVKVTDHIKIAGTVKTDIYAKNFLFGDQTYRKDLFFRNWEFGLGAEFMF